MALFCQCATDWRKYNETRIAKYRNSSYIAHGTHGKHTVFLSYDFQNKICHSECSSGFFQNCTDNCTTQDNNADTGHNASETRLYSVNDFFWVNSPDETNCHSNDRQNNERMQMEFGDCNYHYNNR